MRDKKEKAVSIVEALQDDDWLKKRQGKGLADALEDLEREVQEKQDKNE